MSMIPTNLCSRCDKPAETFNKDWVCEECMSGQLLDWQEPMPEYNPDKDAREEEYLIKKGWISNEAKSAGWWHSANTLHSYWCKDTREAYRTQMRWEMEKKADMINSPAHYNQFGIEVIDVIEAYGFGNNYYMGNVIKYGLRSGYKGEQLTDLKKARWYLDRYIQRLEGADEPV